MCKNTWLALWDSNHAPEPESRDEQKVKDFLMKKYERKVWYSNQPKQKPVQQQSIPEAKPLKQLVGENAVDSHRTHTVRFPLICNSLVTAYAINSLVFHPAHVLFSTILEGTGSMRKS